MNVFNVFLQVIYLYNTLVTDCAGSGRVILDFELEETQVKNEALEKEDEKLEDSIEEVLTEKRTVTKDMNKLSEEHFKLKSDLADVTKANDALGKKC